MKRILPDASSSPAPEKPVCTSSTVAFVPAAWPLAVLFALGSLGALAETRQLDARTLYQRSVSSDIVLSPDGSALELKSGEVIEDDGPASGFSYKPNEERLSDGVVIRKQLLVNDPRASKAALLIGGAGNFSVDLNGNALRLGTPQSIFAGQWHAYTIDPGALRAGLNDIEIRGDGVIRIARADDSYAELPHRSARSQDGGKSWNVDKLGPNRDISGEYYVRLYLEHFVSRGTLLLPVMDVVSLSENPVVPLLEAPGLLRVSPTQATAGSVTFRIRSGSAYVPDAATWSDWEPLGSSSPQVLHGRFFQIEVTLATANPRDTSQLTGIQLSSSPSLGDDWTRTIKIPGMHDEEIVRSSIPFRYEPFTQPQLKELRERYHLDEVVGDAKSDLEILARLAAWSSQQWKWQEWHLDTSYPDWNALEILKRLSDGKRVGGFCQQYSLVFLQAAESFGFVGRDISIDSGLLGRPTTVGHEAIEIWSNQFRKWIWVDGMMAYYAEDYATGIPLSLWELRKRQLAVLRGRQARPIRVVHIVDTHMPATPPWLRKASEWRQLDEGMSFAELRLIPRSNFLEQKYPLPLNNGKAGWSWTGFDVWTDADLGAELIHPRLIARYGNFEWTLNQAHFVLEPLATAGKMRVYLDTVSPGFAQYIARIDGKSPAPVDAIFTWELHPGHNRLEVWPKNDAGRDGIASWIELDVPANGSQKRRPGKSDGRGL